MYIEYLAAAVLVSMVGFSLGYVLWNRMSETRLLRIRVKRLGRQLIAAREMAKRMSAGEDVDREFVEAIGGLSRIYRRLKPGKALPSMFMSLEMAVGELMGYLHLGNREKASEVVKRVSQKVRGIELELEQGELVE